MIIHNTCEIALKSIPDKSIDLVIIDPPYETSNQGGSGCFGEKHRNYYNELKDMSNGFSNNILDELCRVMKKINIYIFCNKKQILQLLSYFKDKNCNFDILIWNKLNPIPACSNTYLRDKEFILFFREKGVKLFGTYESKKTVYSSGINLTEKKKYGHPTIKPLDLIEKLIINSSKENDAVLDCYAGTGTTGVACKKLNRNYILIEKEKQYIYIIQQRLLEEK